VSEDSRQHEPAPAPEADSETAPATDEAPPKGFMAMLRGLLQLDDSPESIALGTSLGIFIALTPTVGIQMILVTVVNTIFRANRLAGLVMVYISNPITMLPIYWFDYQVGRLLLERPGISRGEFEKIFLLRGPNLLTKLQSFVENLATFSFDVAGPLFLGGVVIGIIFALPAYPLTLRLIRQRRARKRAGEVQP